MFNLYLCLLPLFLLIVSLHLIASLLFLFKNISWDTKDTFLLPAYDMLTTQISAFLLISSMLFTLWPQFAICSYNPVLCSPVLVSRWNSVSYQIYKIHLRKYLDELQEEQREWATLGGVSFQQQQDQTGRKSQCIRSTLIQQLSYHNPASLQTHLSLCLPPTNLMLLLMSCVVFKTYFGI